MIQLNNIKKLNHEQLREKIDLNYRAIKTTRAVTYVFDILILMIAGLHIFNIDFTKWLLIPVAGSVLLHSRLSNLYEQQSFLKEQEVIVKYQKNKSYSRTKKLRLLSVIIHLINIFPYIFGKHSSNIYLIFYCITNKRRRNLHNWCTY